MLTGLGSLGRTRASWGDEYEQEALALLSIAPLPQRFSMEGISNILQSGIRQTFGPSGSDKQVWPVSLLPVSFLDSCHLVSSTEWGMGMH